MTNDSKHGGNAFPQSPMEGLPGMSLRDWFAGQALAGMFADTNRDCHPINCALDAYQFADAMLAERERK